MQYVVALWNWKETSTTWSPMKSCSSDEQLNSHFTPTYFIVLYVVTASYFPSEEVPPKLLITGKLFHYLFCLFHCNVTFSRQYCRITESPEVRKYLLLKSYHGSQRNQTLMIPLNFHFLPCTVIFGSVFQKHRRSTCNSLSKWSRSPMKLNCFQTILK